MKWEKGQNPKKKILTQLDDWVQYLVRFQNGQYGIKTWAGDRFLIPASKGNKITHYMKIEAV